MTYQPMLDDLLRSGLHPEDINTTPYIPNGFIKGPVGYKIPYYYPNGEVHPAMYRARLLPPKPDGGKYTQPSTADLQAAGFAPEHATYPYLAPKALGGQNWATLATLKSPIRWVLAEGEKKAAAGCKFLKRPVIGLGGCANGVVKDNPKDKNGPVHLHPVLASLFRPGDTVEVVFDADITTNKDVELAAGTLRRVLLNMGITTEFVGLPGDGGLDDWIVAQPQTDVANLYDQLPRYDGTGLRENVPAIAKQLQLLLNKDKYPLPVDSNVQRVLEGHERYRGKIWHDVIRGMLYETITTGKPIEVTDGFTLREACWFQENLSTAFKPGTVTNGIFSLVSNPLFQRDSFREALDATPWDGVPRCAEMFIKGWGAEDTPYTQALGLNWLPGMVKRATQPGCKVDQMLVLVGEQEKGKSSSLAALGGEWYLETSTAVDSKDFLLAAHRYLVVDLAEMSGFKYADLNHIKALLTTTTDVIRAPYGRAAQTMPRRFVCVGSTNDDRFLRDPTGNRRYLPLVIGKIDIPWIEANRMQLFAEAKVLLDAGAQCWVDSALARPVQESHEMEDPWVAEISRQLQKVDGDPAMLINNIYYSFIGSNILLKMLDIPMQHQHPGSLQRVSQLMKKHFPGWERYVYSNAEKPINVGGEQVGYARGYRRSRSSTPPPTTNVVVIKTGKQLGE